MNIMKTNLRRAILLLPLLAGLPDVSTAAVGRTEGSFAVSPTGSGTYRIPLWAPPGTGGIQPNLTVTYDSQRGTGIMGPGWALTGLSAITRCNRTTAQNGFIGQVTLGYSDMFCLDGKMLRLDLSTGFYGQPGTVYDSEIVEFSQIKIPSTTNVEPDYFIAKTKSGLTIEFGNTQDSRVKPSASSTLHYMWLVNKVTDKAGNSYTVTYGPGASGTLGTAVPLTISYSPTTAGGSTYNYTISFDYTAKTAKFSNTTEPGTRNYVAGNLIFNTNLLLGVKISSGSALVRRYEFGYELAPTTLRARLSTITECASADSTNCFAATTLGYQNGVAGMTTSAISAVATNSPYLGTPDLDGDGRSDVMYAEAGTVKVARGTSNGTSAGFLPTVSIGPTGNGVVGYGDLSNKGFDDIVIKQGASFVAYSWNGTAINAFNIGITPPGVPVKYGLVDVNGDGRADFVSIEKFYNSSTRIYTLTVSTYLNSSTAKNVISFAPVKSYSTTVSCPSSPATPCDADILTGTEFTSGVPRLDFDGDGVANVVMRTLVPTVGLGSVAQVRFLAFNGTGFADIGGLPAQTNQTTLPQIAGFALVNDDNCTDVLLASPASVVTSACGATTGETISVSGTPLASVDWNSDGRSDVLIQYGSNFGALVSTEAGLAPVVDTGIPVSTSAASNAFALDFDGDGLTDLGTWSTAGVVAYRHASPSTPPDLVNSITDGFGANVSPAYVSILVDNYTIGTSAAAPEEDFAKALYVVKSVTSTSGATDGSPATYTQNFWYYEGRQNMDGRGFEGFRRVKVTDLRNSLVRNIYRETDFPYTGMVMTDELLQSDGGLPISRIQNVYGKTQIDAANNNNNNWRWFVYLDSSTTEEFSVEPGGSTNGVSIRKTTVDPTVYDDYGNPTTVVTTIQDTFPSSPLFNAQWTTTVTNAITPMYGNAGDWCMNLPTQTTVTKTAPGSAPTTRTTTFVNDYFKCRHDSETAEPGDSRWQVTTNYLYDGFGNIREVTDTPVTGQNQTARTTKFDWGTSGRKPVTVTDALNQVTSFGYDYNLGTRTSVTDPNGLTTSWTYDSFGRLIREDRPDLTHTEYALSACSAPACVAAAITKIDVSLFPVGPGVPALRTDTQELDIFDRPVRSLQPLLGSVISETTSTYDHYGRLSAQSIPHAKNATGYNVTYQYDLVGRTKQVLRPVNQATPGTLVGTSFAYQGPTTVTTDVLGHTSKVRRNASGLIAQVFDALNHDTDYEYDAFGNLTKVRDYRDNETVLTYNVRGMKMASSDPDMGSSTYDYFPLGELRRQTDAKGQVTDFEYDALSRLTKRSEVEGYSQFNYGSTSASHNIGRIASVVQATPGGTTLYSETYNYDGYARLSSELIQSDSAYQYDYGYDTSSGQLSTLSYPSVPGSPSYRLVLQYNYQNAMLQEIKDFNTGTAYWHINSVNPLGQVTQEVLGNGVITNRTIDAVTGRASNVTSGVNGGTALQNEAYLYDDAGKVTQRQKYNSGLVNLTENFHYDTLERLTSSDVSGVVNSSASTTYDDIGNITSRSDVNSGSAWAYADPAHKHAVTTAGTYTYAYDANGNATARNGYGITWSSYNYPTVINGPNKQLTFSYGPDRQRFKQIYVSGGVTETTMYVGGTLEKVTINGVDDYRHYIRANGATIALVSRKSGVTTTRYLLNDHLDGVASILDSNGGQIVRESFDPFGGRRDAENWDSDCNCSTLAQIASITRHGFTGHEMIGGQSMGLIHMNGRVMDSVTGRFLSADPYVQYPFNGQSLNRYSYVLNNPLSTTDPSGFLGNENGGNDGRAWDDGPGYGFVFGWAWPMTCFFCNYHYKFKPAHFRQQNILATTRATQPAAPVPAVLPPEAPTYIHEVGEVFKGYGDVGWGVLQGTWHLVRHPIDSAKGIYTAVAHPVNTWNAISDQVHKDMGSSRGNGRIVGTILLAALGGSEVKGAAELGEVGNTAKVAEVAEAAEAAEVAKVAEVAEASKVSQVADAAASSPVGRRTKIMSEADRSPHTPQHVNPAYQPVQNAAGSVNGVRYSGHAFDQMRNRGLVPSVVENALRTGTRAAGNTPGTTVVTDSVNSVRVIVNAEGRVITVE